MASPTPRPPGPASPDRRQFLKTLAAAPALAWASDSKFGRLLRALGWKPLRGSNEYWTLYCVGYAHLDTQWRWSYPIVIREYIRNTMEANFPLFEKYPDYIFNFTGANRYRLMQEYYPAEFERVRRYVAAGRWFPAGSAWEEGIVDEPSSESIVRQVLYGNQYFRRVLGKASNEFMLPDSFGFPASLPSLLAHAGLKGFSTQKLTWGSAVGIPFNVGVWEGLDGRGVVAALNATPYVGKLRSDLSRDPEWVDRLRGDGARCGVYSDYRYYGTGDRGGAPDEESVQWLETSLAGTGPVHVVSATGAQMFEDLTAEQVARLPRYRGDLLLTEHSAGTPSSQSFMKKLNRRNEFRADEAERAAVAAAFVGGGAYPREALVRGWQMVLAGQFHDMLAGTAKPDAYHYGWNDGFVARNQLTLVRDEGVGAVARALDTQLDGSPLVVFNSLAHPRTDVVEARWRGPAPAAASAVGPDGKPASTQMTRGFDGEPLVLILADAPPAGFSVFGVRAADAPPPANPELQAGERSLENARYRVEVNEQGDIAQIHDKREHRDLLAAPARLAFLRENPDLYPAWNMRWVDASRAPYAYVEGPARMTVVERGPVRVALRIERQALGSTIVQTVRLAAGAAGDRVEFETFIDWHTRESALKAVFPLTVANPRATYNWEAGTIERANDEPKRFEWPSHQWFDLTDASGDYGVTVLEDCKYGSDKPDDHTLRLTLMYTPGGGHVIPPGKYADQMTQDFGRHRFIYALAGHAGDWRQGDAHWQAARLNQPLTAFWTQAHPGPAGKTFSLLKVSGAQVMVKALKLAEDSDEVVVRLQELEGRTAPAVTVEAAAPIVAAREVDGQERPIGPATLREGKLIADLGAYRLRAFALRLGPAAATIPPPTSVSVALPFDTRAASRDGQALAPGQGMDSDGRSLPAEMLPLEIRSGGVDFRLGSPAAANALACRGQGIALPQGDFNDIFLLAASSAGPAAATFEVDGRPVALEVPAWDGFIGQPDYRLWDSTEYPEVSYGWGLAFRGVAPGYLRTTPLAWFCSHRHGPDGANEIYRYCYLFRLRIALDGPAGRLTLPSDDRIKLFALTLARDTGDATVPASPDLGVM